MFDSKNNILIVILILCIFYCIYKINNLENKLTNKVENFTTDLPNEINTAVKKIYLADVEAIRLLSNFAIQLSQGGFTVPGTVKITGNISTTGTYFSTPADHDISCAGNQRISGNGTLFLLNNQGVSVSKLFGGNGNLRVDGDLDVKGKLIASKDIETPADHVFNCAGNQRIRGNGVLFLLNTQGVSVSKSFGGNGNLTVDGDLNVKGKLIAEKDIETPADHVFNCAGNQRIRGNGVLFLLNTQGVSVSKSFGGNGNLTVDGEIGCVGGIKCASIKIGNTVITEEHLKILTGVGQIKLKHTGGSTNYSEKEWVTVEGGGGNHIVKWDEAASAFFSLIKV